MQPHTPKITTEILLVGGGHAHVHVIRAFGMKPVRGVRLSVISSDVSAPYSGMLPGFIAGHYTREEVHIDLPRLCQFAGARFIHGSVCDVDAEAQTVLLEDGRSMYFDALSLNFGSVPDDDGVPGADVYAVGVKPIPRFLAALDQLERTHDPHRIAVVGGGVGGTELTLALQHRFRNRPFSFDLFCAGAEVLPTQPARARRLFTQRLAARGITLHTHSKVTAVEPGRVFTGDGANPASAETRSLNTHSDESSSHEADTIFWTTRAAPPDWLRETRLSVNEKGFLRTGDDLRVIGQARIFAVGDCATMDNHPREKAGVFAVRQGAPLERNLRALVTGAKPQPFTPQRNWLSLISTGDKYAVGTRAGLTFSGRWLWRWKDRIDRTFMDKYNALDPSAMPLPDPVRVDDSELQCAGCAAKVDGDVLGSVLRDLTEAFPQTVQLNADDAAEITVPEGRLIQSVDHLPALCSDPHLFGRIAAAHALSDLYASGAQPHSAQAIVALPQASAEITRSDLTLLLSGAAEVLEGAGAQLIGGHSVTGPMALGFAVNGTGPIQLAKGVIRPGDRLILTKPLGAGVIMAAAMRLKADGGTVQATLDAMTLTNQVAMEQALKHGALAATDVTGFGLAGHAQEMAAASGVDLHLHLQNVPVADEAMRLAEDDIRSSLFDSNLRLVPEIAAQALTDPKASLLCDPQTSGGLLIAIAAGKADALCADIQARGVLAVIIGEATDCAGAHPAVRLSV